MDGWTGDEAEATGMRSAHENERTDQPHKAVGPESPFLRI